MPPECLRKYLQLPPKYKAIQLLLAPPRPYAGAHFLRICLIFFPQLAEDFAMRSSLLLAAFIFPLLFLLQRDDDYLKWQEDRKLTWDDFKAEPVKMGSTAAMTTTHLSFGYNVSNGIITYKIDCRFEKKKSWGLVKNSWILKHEQGHFDIAEIFARRLNQATSEYEFNQSTFQKDLDAIYKTVVADKEAFQQLYDDETDYSRNKNKQEDWLKKIEKELKASKDWAGY